MSRLIVINEECEHCHLVNGDHQMWCQESRSDEIPAWVWLGIIGPMVMVAGWFIGQWIGWLVWS